MKAFESFMKASQKIVFKRKHLIYNKKEITKIVGRQTNKLRIEYSRKAVKYINALD